VEMTRFVFLLVGVALFVYLSLQIGLERIASTVREIGWAFLPVVIIYGCYQGLRAAALLMSLPGGGHCS
jgi:hypothetical protein